VRVVRRGENKLGHQLFQLFLQHQATPFYFQKFPYGLPKTICVDNGPEFTTRALDQWAHQRGVKLQFSRPGKPTDNAMIETFNAKVRAECLHQHWFSSLEEAKTHIEAWHQDYNEQRLHSSFDNQTPAESMACVQHRKQPEKAKS
jgi:putative transposase